MSRHSLTVILSIVALATGALAQEVREPVGDVFTQSNAPGPGELHLHNKRDRHLGKREYYPAQSWQKGVCAVIDGSCKPSMVTEGIQDSECYKNVRVHHVTGDNGLQSFATFKIDHKYDNNQYISYGTCAAYKCSLSKIVDWKPDCDCAFFSWEDSMPHKEDFGAIQEPQTGLLECETSDGKERGQATGEWGCAHMPTHA